MIDKLYYDIRISINGLFLLSLLFLPFRIFVAWLTWQTRGIEPSPQEIKFAFETIMPLSAGMASAHLMSIEREIDFSNLRFSYPEPSWQIPLLRLTVVVLFSALSILGSVFILVIARQELVDVVTIVWHTLPPTFYMTSLSLLLANLTHNSWATGGAIIAYWYMELRMGGTFTQSLYIFAYSMPNDSLEISYTLNRSFLISAGMVFIIANIAFTIWRRRR